MGCRRTLQHRASASHVVIRGVRDSGEVLRLSRTTLQQGIRSIAADLCTRQLGYRTELDSAEADAREVTRSVSPRSTEAPDGRAGVNPGPSHHCSEWRHTLDLAKPQGFAATRVSRLAVLSQMGLAESTGPNSWRLRRDFDESSPGNAEKPRTDSGRLPRTGP